MARENERAGKGDRFPKLARGRLTISSEVSEVLRWRIIDGSIPAGTRLGEELISREMDISRGPVREALRELETEGLIAVEPYRGAVVIGISEAELRSVLIPIRWILEKSAVESAIKLMTEDDLSHLESIVHEMYAVANSGAPNTLRQLVELDVSFHDHVLQCANDYHTRQLWKTIQPRIRMGFYQLGSRHEQSSDIATEHGELLAALRTRDLQVVLAALDAHAMRSPIELLDKNVVQSKTSPTVTLGAGRE